MTSSKLHGLNYSSDGYTVGRSKGSGGGQIVMNKIENQSMWLLRVDTRLMTYNQ